MERWIRVDVGPGMFSSEKSVSFTVGGVRYSLFVSPDDLKNGDMLLVRMVSEGRDECIIELPQETLTTGRRVRVPRALVA